jgi:hypothetical protein
MSPDIPPGVTAHPRSWFRQQRNNDCFRIVGETPVLMLCGRWALVCAVDVTQLVPGYWSSIV